MTFHAASRKAVHPCADPRFDGVPAFAERWRRRERRPRAPLRVRHEYTIQSKCHVVRVGRGERPREIAEHGLTSEAAGRIFDNAVFAWGPTGAGMVARSGMPAPAEPTRP